MIYLVECILRLDRVDHAFDVEVVSLCISLREVVLDGHADETDVVLLKTWVLPRDTFIDLTKTSSGRHAD